MRLAASSHAQGKKKQWRCAFVGISTGCGRVGLLGCARPVGVASVAGAPTLCVRNICEYTSVATRPCRGARTSMAHGRRGLGLGQTLCVPKHLSVARLYGPPPIPRQLPAAAMPLQVGPPSCTRGEFPTSPTDDAHRRPCLPVWLRTRGASLGRRHSVRLCR